MLLLTLSLLFLIATHVVPSQAAVRESLIGAVGRSAFYAGYSLISTLALAAVIIAYRMADAGSWLWYPGLEGRYVALALMPVAFFLLVCRFTQNPARMAGRGIYRITTTPGSLAVLTWSGVHLLNVGATRTVVVFLGMAAIAVISLWRNAARAGQGLAGALPFARILAGRERLVFGEIGFGRVALALGITLAIVLLHPFVIGVDPLAGVL